MGTTIHYQARISSSEKIKETIDYLVSLAKSYQWDVENQADVGIFIFPHPECEPITFKFDNKLRISGHVKTSFSPLEIHVNIVKFLFDIKPLFSEFIVYDESGIWDEHEKFGDTIFDKLHSFDTIKKSEIDVDNIVISIPTTPEQLEKWFWIDDCWSEYLHYPTLRDKMINDLNQGVRHLTVPDIFKAAEEAGFVPFSCEEGRPEFPFMTLAYLWAWNSKDKASKKKQSKCKSFSWALTELCLGFHGGFLDKYHRQAVLKIINQDQDLLTPEDTLIAFYDIVKLYEFEF
jgi:hypothetical protein